MIKLHLKKGHERRFNLSHPWVYSNELSEVPRKTFLGDEAELHDCHGNFLARGYVNAHSLIAFRVVSRSFKVEEPLSHGQIFHRLVDAGKLREFLGLSSVSHRLCFGEADFLPGLVIDFFRGESAQIFVVQAHTAGMDKALANVLLALEQYVSSHFCHHGGLGWDKTGILINNNISVRQLEGLEIQNTRVAREIQNTDLTQFKFLVKSASPQNPQPISFTADLLAGQKTGFFFDQFSNIYLACELMNHSQVFAEKTLKILDLFCYVGQWGAQLAAHFTKLGFKVEVTAIDASKTALEFAKKNITAAGGTCLPKSLDIMKDLNELEKRHYDIVICDPPALIKKRKDIPVGTKAYLKINAQALSLVKANGVFIACSCSALLDEVSFTETLTKAAVKSERQIRMIGRGQQSADHPVLLSFPEGNYLKSWIGVV